MQSTQAPTCSVDGCDRRRRDGDYCPAHGQRVRRNGSPGAARIGASTKPPSERRCEAPGCGRAHYCGGMCTMHYQRQRAHGTTASRARPHGEAHCHWKGDEIEYRAAHTRLEAARGPAASHACVDCGARAAHWSYDHADPDERRSSTKGNPPYSIKLQHYSPRCVPCHKAFDLGRLAA